MFFTQPHKKKSNGVKCGDLGDQAIGPRLLNHLSAQLIPNMVAEMWLHPSCWRKV
ncbi:hypothetical protein B7P43_G01257 [Cryptotermes secundus]|uniref:Uncharacterized protein n=1 Tax=Cryptotermes secundus TaxID=105785 RepID=A0A2J7QNJ7_9NEOP|nr:hypothetical protein B7P43_G01257 [Cryptotermes secundus]